MVTTAGRGCRHQRPAKAERLTLRFLICMQAQATRFSSVLAQLKAGGQIQMCSTAARCVRRTFQRRCPHLPSLATRDARHCDSDCQC
jgi:hypothetical protein